MSDVKFYHPVPFEGEWPEASRNDCEARWQAIRKEIGPLPYKSLIDIGCANGYFLFRFMQDGGYRAHGVEPNEAQKSFVNEISKEKNLNVKCFSNIKEVKGRYAVGLYLDLHFHEGINYLDWLKENVDIMFASPSGDGNFTTKKLHSELCEIYKNVVPIYNGFSGRITYKCWDVK